MAIAMPSITFQHDMTQRKKTELLSENLFFKNQENFPSNAASNSPYFPFVRTALRALAQVC